MFLKPLSAIDHSSTGMSNTEKLETRRDIFRRGSRTYFMSSMFFPKKLREKVAILYAFVRVADDFVDCVPQNFSGFAEFEDSFWKASEGTPSNNHVIDAFVQLLQSEKIELSWVSSFLAAMRSDLNHQSCQTVEDTIKYMYGSAEVIGLMMCQLMNLPKVAHPAAMRLGRAMQYINFLRDLDEDRRLGRNYLPYQEQLQFGLPNLDPTTAQNHMCAFTDFIKFQAQRYFEWQAEAEAGFHFLPWHARVPVATASDMYKWTAKQILAEPMTVYKVKVKPAKRQVILRGLLNSYLQRDTLIKQT